MNTGLSEKLQTYERWGILDLFGAFLPVLLFLCKEVYCKKEKTVERREIAQIKRTVYYTFGARGKIR